MMSVPQALAMAGQHYQAGHWQQADQLCRQILQLDANQVHAWHLLGLIACQTGRDNLAVDYLQGALRLKPDWAEAHNNLGNVFIIQKNLPQAVASYQQALRLKPDHAEAHNNLAIALEGQGKLAEAVVSFEQALRLKPDYAEAHYNLGTALQGQGKLAEAVVHFEQALRLKPDYAEAHYNLGTALQEEVKAEAVASYQEALRLRPDYAEAHHNLSMLWLLQGNFEQGWPEYEWRWQTKEFLSSSRPHPKWDGSPLDGKTILLYAEQGLGDTLQFIRYAAVVKQRGGTVVAESYPDLLGVLAGCPGIDHLLLPGGPLPACDVRAPLLSLPGLCGTTLATIPAEVPYLVADRSRVGHWRDRLAAVSGFKVGICWQGSPGHKNDRRRSVPLAQFAPLAEIPGLRLVSLQKGPGREQWAALAGNWPVVDLPGQAEEPSQSWVDTAALVCTLDLVITVDTAIAHLAGALGVPVWVALPFSPDWRWLLGREDSPWYPTMRLFRQSRHDHWPDVFERIAVELKRVIAEKQVHDSSCKVG